MKRYAPLFLLALSLPCTAAFAGTWHLAASPATNPEAHTSSYTQTGVGGQVFDDAIDNSNPDETQNEGYYRFVWTRTVTGEPEPYPKVTQTATYSGGLWKATVTNARDGADAHSNYRIGFSAGGLYHQIGPATIDVSAGGGFGPLEDPHTVTGATLSHIIYVANHQTEVIILVSGDIDSTVNVVSGTGSTSKIPDISVESDSNTVETQ